MFPILDFINENDIPLQAKPNSEEPDKIVHPQAGQAGLNLRLLRMGSCEILLEVTTSIELYQALCYFDELVLPNSLGDG